MKDTYKLRKKVAEKSTEAELFKNKYTNALVEIMKLKEELVKALENGVFKLPFVEETKHELFCAEHADISKAKASTGIFKDGEEICLGDILSVSDDFFDAKKEAVEPSTTSKEILEQERDAHPLDSYRISIGLPTYKELLLKEKKRENKLKKHKESINIPVWDKNARYESGKGILFGDKKLYAFEDGVKPSRFMPNVKFKNFLAKEKTISVSGLSRKEYLFTNNMGRLFSYKNQIQYLKDVETKEVSIYEAMPELVPERMMIDKESGDLANKFSYEKFEQGLKLAKETMKQLKSIAKRVATKTPFTFSEVYSVAASLLSTIPLDEIEEALLKNYMSVGELKLASEMVYEKKDGYLIHNEISSFGGKEIKEAQSRMKEKEVVDRVVSERKKEDIPSWKFKNDSSYPLNPESPDFSAIQHAIFDIAHYIGMPKERVEHEFLKLCMGKPTKEDIIATMLFGSINKAKKMLCLPNSKLKEELLKIVDTFRPLSGEEEVVDSATSFSSRFMPNVKFDAVKFKTNFADILIEKEQAPMLGCAFFKTDSNGKLTACPNLVTYCYWEEKEVSIYEAIPELVPKGMVYDKESDSLVKKVCANQMCAGEFCDCDDSHSFAEDATEDKELTKAVTTKTFAGELSRATPFSIGTCLSVIEDYGKRNARAALDLIAIGADPSGFKLKKS